MRSSIPTLADRFLPITLIGRIVLLASETALITAVTEQFGKGKVTSNFAYDANQLSVIFSGIFLLAKLARPFATLDADKCMTLPKLSTIGGIVAEAGILACLLLAAKHSGPEAKLGFAIAATVFTIGMLVYNSFQCKQTQRQYEALKV